MFGSRRLLDLAVSLVSCSGTCRSRPLGVSAAVQQLIRLLEQVEEAIFVILEYAQAIELLFEFKCFRSIILRLPEEGFDPLFIARLESRLFRGFYAIAFLLTWGLVSQRRLD